MGPKKQTIGDRIDALVLKSGKTYGQVAVEAGFSRSYMSYVVNNKRIPGATVLNGLCRVLGCTPNYILGWEERER